MRDLVVHPKSGLMLDFADDDFGGPEQAAVIDAWQDRHHAVEGEFICHQHRNHERPALYLQQRGNLIIAAHWPGSALDGSHEFRHGVSDEHKRQVEYVQRAGEAEGFRVATEVRLPTMVRPDAVIYGPEVQMGVEVQRSALAVPAAKARTTKIRRAGVEPVWFSDNRSNPPWFGKVPGVRMMDTPWDTLPNQRSVTVVSGLRRIVPRKCRNIQNGQCPRRRSGCNQWHPDHDPLAALVDDLAAAVPAGKYMPMVYRTFSGLDLVLIVSRNDKRRYEEMVGRPADVPLRQREQEHPQQEGERILCVADAGSSSKPEPPHWQPPPIYPSAPKLAPTSARHQVTGVCRVCGGRVLSSSPWPDCHPACHQWPDSGWEGGG